MELALDLVWAIAALVLLGMVYRGIRGGSKRISMASAMMLGLLICFILLPAISVSDDLLDARQAALPLSGQTWRIASEGISSGLDQLLAVALYLTVTASQIHNAMLPIQNCFARGLVFTT